MAIVAEELCSELLQLDRSIRFVGMANQMGSLITAKYRHGLLPLLTSEELHSNAMNAVLRMKTRGEYESKLGKAIYTFGLYERVKRASIMLNDGNFSLLMVSFDINADHEPIILNKIIPRMKQLKLISQA